MIPKYDLLTAQINEYPGWRVLGWDYKRDAPEGTPYDVRMVVENTNEPDPLRMGRETSIRIVSREQWDKLTDKLRQAATLMSVGDRRPMIYEGIYHDGGVCYGIVYQPYSVNIGDTPTLPHPEVFKEARIIWEKG